MGLGDGLLQHIIRQQLTGMLNSKLKTQSCGHPLNPSLTHPPPPLLLLLSLNCVLALPHRRVAAEVEGDVLGEEFKGYVFKIMGGQDKQVRAGFWGASRGMFLDGRDKGRGWLCVQQRKGGWLTSWCLSCCCCAPCCCLLLLLAGLPHEAGCADQRPREADDVTR